MINGTSVSLSLTNIRSNHDQLERAKSDFNLNHIAKQIIIAYSKDSNAKQVFKNLADCLAIILQVGGTVNILGLKEYLRKKFPDTNLNNYAEIITNIAAHNPSRLQLFHSLTEHNSHSNSMLSLLKNLGINTKIDNRLQRFNSPQHRQRTGALKEEYKITLSRDQMEVFSFCANKDIFQKKEYPNIVIFFVDMDLSGLYIDGFDFKTNSIPASADEYPIIEVLNHFSKSNYDNSILVNVTLGTIINGRFVNATLINCNIIGIKRSNLQGVKLINCKIKFLTECNLENSQIINCCIDKIYRCILDKAKVQIKQSDTDSRAVSFNHNRAVGTIFTNCDFNELKFEKCDLSEVVFDNNIFNFCTFYELICNKLLIFRNCKFLVKNGSKVKEFDSWSITKSNTALKAIFGRVENINDNTDYNKIIRFETTTQPLKNLNRINNLADVIITYSDNSSNSLL